MINRQNETVVVVVVLLCSHSHNDVPHEPERFAGNVVMRMGTQLKLWMLSHLIKSHFCLAVFELKCTDIFKFTNFA